MSHDPDCFELADKFLRESHRLHRAEPPTNDAVNTLAEEIQKVIEDFLSDYEREAFDDLSDDK